MRKTLEFEETLFPDLTARFVSTRYQGSKSKLVEQIWEEISAIHFSTCLDAFGGTGSVAYMLKKANKPVAYNDALRFNYYFGLALIENSHVRLTSEDLDWVLDKHSHIQYPRFVQETFTGIYFTDEENAWIDQAITNIRHFTNPYKFALAFFALCQACIIKRPFNLFHRRNLYIRLSEVERTFGNKASWDRPFHEWFRFFASEANQAVFENGRENRSLNFNAVDAPGSYDLVYIDTPYISRRGVSVDYLQFYHFLEGLSIYDEWDNYIDRESKHLRFKPQANEWTDSKLIYGAFNRLFKRYQESVLVVSYRSDGIPSESELVSLLKRYKSSVRLVHLGPYKYVLSTNGESKEILLIGE